MNEEKKTGAEDIIKILTDLGCTPEEATTVINIVLSAYMRKTVKDSLPNATKREEKPFEPYSCSFNELAGKTLEEVKVVRDTSDMNDEIIFYCTDGTAYRMYHEQNCCESVTIDDICGDIELLIGKPISFARVATSTSEDDEDRNNDVDSYTWTFYHIANINTYVTIRWYGESNGYYSESVNFERIM